MRIFFTTPFSGKKLYQPNIDYIINILDKKGISVISPEKENLYKEATAKDKILEYGNFNRAHYEFIRQGIASSDAFIIEASQEDFRVGHEMTLGLIYNKPVLVLSQKEDYSEYITHERLFGRKYKNNSELESIISDFLKKVIEISSNENFQVMEDVVDLRHSATLSNSRFKATQGDTYFSFWAQRSLSQPDQVISEVYEKLGGLEIQKPWDVFAKIYHEDTPDQIFFGAAKFIDKVYRSHGLTKSDRLVDAACGTGSLSRLMTSFGYKFLTSFDRSRAMLSEAYRLCSHLPNIKIIESDIENFRVQSPVKGIFWLDFSSNCALDEEMFKKWILNLIDNLDHEGILIFDLRTITGWNVDFFKNKVILYETDNFQRISIHTHSENPKSIRMDIFIRIKDTNGNWQNWEREQMIERKWSLKEIKNIVHTLTNVKILGIYGDDFRLLNNDSNEPGLGYFSLIKN